MKEKNKNPKSTKLTFIFILLMVILAILQIVFANQEANAGRTLQRLEQEIAHLETENKLLEITIASQGSLESLKEKAEKLGFNQGQSILNLSKQKEVVLNFQR